MVTIGYDSKSSNTNLKQKNQKSYKDDWDKPVLISSISPIHNYGYVPSRANRISVVTLSWNYTKKIPNHALFQLCFYVDAGLQLSHQTIKYAIKNLEESTSNQDISCRNVSLGP